MACTTSPLCALEVGVWRETRHTVVDLTGELEVSGGVPRPLPLRPLMDISWETP